MKKKCILITGSSGFVGQSMVAYFHQLGWTIDSIDRNITGYASIRRQFNWQELSQIDFSPYDSVVHLAGKAHDLKNESLKDEYDVVNYQLTRTLYDSWLVSKNPQSTFIFLSTILVLGEQDNKVLTESLHPSPSTPYAQSKLSAEQYISTNGTKDEGVYILRPSLIYGPGVKGNLKKLMTLLKKRVPLPFGSIRTERSYFYIGNLNFVVQELIVAGRTVSPGVYHLADDETISLKDLIKRLAVISGRSVLNVSMPLPILQFLAHLGDHLALPFNSEILGKLTRPLIVSNARIKKALNIRQMPYTFDQGIEDVGL